MSGLFFLQQAVRPVMAPRTDKRWRVFTILYLCGPVYRVAGHTVRGGQFDVGAMGFVACAAVRDVPVSFSMAISAGHISGMLAGIILDFLILFGMAKAARGLNLFHGNY